MARRRLRPHFSSPAPAAGRAPSFGRTRSGWPGLAQPPLPALRRGGSAHFRRRPPLRRWLRRNRRLAVTLLLSLAAGLAVQQLTPQPDPTVSAWAAARDLPAGTILTANDLAALRIPPAVLPAGTLERTALEGKQLAVALRQGQLLSDSLLVGPGLLAGSPSGSGAVPLRMADPASVQLVSPGQLVNVVMTSGNGYEQAASSQVLASAVPVLWTSARGGRAGQWLDAGDTDGLIVVAANADQARRLAGASTQGKLFFVLVGPGAG